MKKVSLFVYLLYFTFNVFSQSNEVKHDFQFLLSKIEKDYPGFGDKVNFKTKKRYDFLVDSLKNVLNDKNSYEIYNSYSNFFKDYHLRIGKNRIQVKPELTEKSSYGETFSVDELTVKDYVKNSTNLSAIEGIWQSRFREKILIKKEKNSFIGIKLNDESNWKKGEVLYEFIPKSDSVYELIRHTKVKGRIPNKSIASLEFNGKVLEFHGTSYFIKTTGDNGKISFSDKAFLATYRMKYPNGLNVFYLATSLSDSTFYLRVPGFNSYAQKFIEDVLEKNKDLISRTPNLIIDIRSNGGGQDNAYQPLANLIYTAPYFSKGVEWYATKGWIKFIKTIIKNNKYKRGEDGKKFLEHLVSEMKTNIGGFVIHPDMGKDHLIQKDTVFKYPKKVGIIINENVASSAEQFLLMAKNSKKVTIFGNQNTAGVLDYSNTVPIDFPSGKYYVYIPQTRSRRLPENPIDNIGIKPDVNIPFADTRDLYDNLDIWARYVKNYLEL